MNDRPTDPSKAKGTKGKPRKGRGWVDGRCACVTTCLDVAFASWAAAVAVAAEAGEQASGCQARSSSGMVQEDEVGYVD